ncbi:hypothetical protein CXB49_11755 [Chromobacterium sp. ATCC 53434]|uniref:hypothetical protein n=1 Tax=Chromobacterium TaxID=535 RepID=UPI000C792A0D|nr:hypothetical protein [Chromobacterium sp. ATCC 53434]AUH51444.1 hypothetical protein CXB49_11755 [Chromobacterium sp. ATCC 53434]
MFESRRETLAFELARPFLRSTTARAVVELSSPACARTVVNLTLERFDTRGVFLSAIEHHIAFDALDAAFMIDHGSHEDLRILLQQCRRQLRRALREVPAADCPDQAELGRILSLPWILAA